MASTYVNITTAANEIQEMWSPLTVDAYTNSVVLAPLVNTEYKSGLTKGDTENVTTFGTLSARSKSADTDVTFDANTEGTLQIVINNHKYVAFRIEKIAELQANLSISTKYTDMAGKGLAIDFDTAIATLFQGFTQIVGTQAVDVSDANIQTGFTYLNTANVPKDSRYFVFSELQTPAFMNEDKFVNSQYQGDKGPAALALAKFGRIYNMDWIESTNLVFNTGGLGGHDGAIFQKDAIATIMQQTPTVLTQLIIEAIADAVVIHQVYGVKEMRDTSGVWVKGR